jgi:hypothetical protein
MKKLEQESPLHVHPRETEVISLTLPKDVLASLRQVAAQRDMSYQALLKWYIGQGLRQDLTRKGDNHAPRTDSSRGISS